jgi:hypothetical protein
MTAEVDPGAALAKPISVGGAERPFGELTADEVEAHAASLAEATGYGHRSRVAAVAGAWRALASLMRERGAATVADLGPEEVAARAEALWVVPPGGSILP